MNKDKIIINKLKKISIKPIENIELVSNYIFDSIYKKKTITFYNWECPPRFIDKDKNGKKFINYCVNLNIIRKGEKIDDYTEIPRVIIRKKEEIKILNYLKSLNFSFRFVKIIADTNFLYITPESLKYLNKNDIANSRKEFINLVVEESKSYPVPVQVFAFTKIIKPFQNIYKNTYKKTLFLLKNNRNKIIDNLTYNRQLIRTKRHIGLKDKKEIEVFTDRTIATYSAEGIVFDKLSNTNYFSNCIWLNIEEVNDRTIDISNIFRKKRGIGNLPMFFPNLNLSKD